MLENNQDNPLALDGSLSTIYCNLKLVAVAMGGIMEGRCEWWGAHGCVIPSIREQKRE